MPYVMKLGRNILQLWHSQIYHLLSSCFLIILKIYCKAMKYWPIILTACLIVSVFPIYVPLHNGLYSDAGGYTVTISLGTPAQQFEVQVDTGSAKLVVGCITCNECRHPHPNFDYTRSSTFQSLSCNSGSEACDNCGISAQGADSCLLDTSYQDGGWLKGQMVSDIFSLPGLAQGIQTNFGCASSESNDMLTDPTSDGIWGVGKSSTDQNGDTVRMDQLITGISGQANSPRLISLCLAMNGGKMNIGSVDTSLHSQSGITIPYDDATTDTISSSLSTIAFGSAVLTSSGSSEMPQLIIDSGATASILSANMYQQIVNLMNGVCTQLGQGCSSYTSTNRKGASNPCFTLSDSSLFGQFPPITFTFNGSPVSWYAEEYLYEDQTNSFCVSFSSSTTAGEYLLGDDFMLNKDIVYGESAITIYPQSSCSGEFVSYAYLANRMQLSASNQAPPMDHNSVQRILLCVGLVIAFVLFVFAVVYIVRCLSSKKDNNPEEVIDDGIATDVRFNQEMAEKKTVQNN